MSTDTQILFKDECYRIMGACMAVYNDKGSGFLEGVYQDCLEIELAYQAIPFEAQKPLEISYRGQPIKHSYFPDLICYRNIIVELKAVKEIADEHRAQVFNYLKATGLKLGILVNFGSDQKLQWERIIRERPQTNPNL
jgi:GxxExxY protein